MTRQNKMIKDMGSTLSGSTVMTDETPIVAACSDVFKSLGGSLSRFLRGADNLQDLMQDVFCRLWVRRDTLHSASEAAALTAVTARNMAIDSYRRGSRRSYTQIDDYRDADVSPSAEDDYALREQYDIVSRLIETALSPIQQKVLQMRDVEGCSYKQIAEELGLEETSIRMNLSRARKKIRDIYVEKYE